MMISMKRILGLFLAAALLVIVMGQAPAADAVKRPKVLGVAHMAIYVKDLAKTRQFYEDFMGFGEPFTLPQKSGGGVRIAFIKVNDRQYFEIFNEADRGEGQLNHISLYTDDGDRMDSYLKSKGLAVIGDKGAV